MGLNWEHERQDPQAFGDGLGIAAQESDFSKFIDCSWTHRLSSLGVGVLERCHWELSIEINNVPKQSTGGEKTRRLVKMGKEEDMVCCKTMSPLRDAREVPIEGDQQGDFKNVVYGHRGWVLHEAEAKRAGEGTNPMSGMWQDNKCISQVAPGLIGKPLSKACGWHRDHAERSSGDDATRQKVKWERRRT